MPYIKHGLTLYWMHDKGYLQLHKQAHNHTNFDLEKDKSFRCCTNV